MTDDPAPAHSRRSGVSSFILHPSSFIALTSALLLGLGPSPGLAADPPAVVKERPAVTPPGLNDCKLTLRVRQELDEDPILASLNLGVSVRNYIATLWGPVPSSDLSRRAEERIRQVTGIADVVNHLRIAPASKPKLELQRPPALKKAAPPPKTPLPDLTKIAGALMGRSADQINPAPPVRVAAAGAAQNLPTIPSMPAITLPKSDTGFAVGPAVVPTAPRPVETPVFTLIESVETLRRSEVRFGGVQATVVAGVVRLGGTARSAADLFELAKAVSRLPGVERVILEDVRLNSIQ